MSSKYIATLAATLVLTLFTVTASQSTELSNFFLPGHIEAEDGQISLYADYGSIQTDGRVPVYLVNRSANELVLNAQDGDIYLKLQFQDSDGSWVRAQPHAYSFCGNSYSRRTLKPGNYLLVNGFQPINGTPSTIRYELYSQDIALSSNIGFGVVLESDIERASSDAMSLREGG